MMSVAQGANQSYYVQAELALGQREGALLLGPATLVVEFAIAVHAPTDHQLQAYQPRECGDRASVVVGDPQLPLADRAVIVHGFQPELGGGFGTALVPWHRDFLLHRGRLPRS
jgi:hypothetical protein